MNEKNLIKSKTLWTNAIAMLALLTQSQFGFILDADAQLAILAVINIILRFVTKGAISWGAGPKKTIGVFFILVMLAGCSSSFLKSDIEKGKLSPASKILLAKRELIIQIAGIADKFCSAGILKQGDCDKMGNAYEKSMPAYDTLVGILILAEKQKDNQGTWEQYNQVRNEFLRLFIDIYNLAVEFKIMDKLEEINPELLQSLWDSEFIPEIGGN